MATLNSNSGRESAGRTTHATRKRVEPKPAAADKRRGSSHLRNPLSEQEWHEMVAVAAYFRGQARGFEGASAEDDWYEAEAELRAQLAESGRIADAVPVNASPQKRGKQQ